MEKTDAKIFSEVPNELKTIEIDVEKKIFNVNGVPFVGIFSEFNINCKAGDGFKIEMDIDNEENSMKLLEKLYSRGGEKDGKICSRSKNF